MKKSLEEKKEKVFGSKRQKDEKKKRSEMSKELNRTIGDGSVVSELRANIQTTNSSRASALIMHTR